MTQKTIKDQFCSYEIALAMKELGFDEECIAFWFNKEKKLSIETEYRGILLAQRNKNSNFNQDCNYLSAPLWQQAIDFFREKYNIHIWVYYCMILESNFYQIRQEISKNEYHNYTNDLDSNILGEFTFEQSREQAILKCIELIKKQNGTN